MGAAGPAGVGVAGQRRKAFPLGQEAGRPRRPALVKPKAPERLQRVGGNRLGTEGGG